MQLAVSSDMLIEGRHFLSTVDPRRLGHKALAVNLSDLAACGAQPLAFTLAISLPVADARWLEPFATGLLALAEARDPGDLSTLDDPNALDEIRRALVRGADAGN